MLGKCLHDGILQFGTPVVASGNSIYTYGHNNAVLIKHLLRDAARQSVNLMSIHSVIDIDVERADKNVGTIVVKDNIKYAVDSLKTEHLMFDLFQQFGRDTTSQQFINGRSQHLYTSLDDDNRYQGTQYAVEGDMP